MFVARGRGTHKTPSPRKLSSYSMHLVSKASGEVSSGGFEPYIRHSTKVEGGSSNEVYPALLGNRLKTLTGTGYRRNTPHPIASRSKNRTTNQKVVGSSPAERTPNPPANG